MKHYSIFTAMVYLPSHVAASGITPFVISLPDNAIILDVEQFQSDIRPGYLVHYLIPCDEDGELIIEESIPKNIYKTAWEKLSQVFGEQLNQDALDTMDGVFDGIKIEAQDEVERQKEDE